MNRRQTLKALGLIAVGSTVASQACVSEDKGEAVAANVPKQLPGVQDVEHERVKKLYAETFFSTHELATITILADIIIPADEVSPSASAVGVPDFIEFIVKDIPSYQIPMRGGLKWLDVFANKQSGNAFKELSKEDQLKIVDQIAYPSKAKPEVAQGVTFFNLMRNLTSSGFYTTKEGIADIGYVGNRPGVWEGVPADVLKEHGFLES